MKVYIIWVKNYYINKYVYIFLTHHYFRNFICLIDAINYIINL